MRCSEWVIMVCEVSWAWGMSYIEDGRYVVGEVERNADKKPGAMWTGDGIRRMAINRKRRGRVAPRLCNQ